MRKFLIGMFCTYPDNKVSSTKVWNAIGMIVMSSMFIYLGIDKEIPEWMGWAFVFYDYTIQTNEEFNRFTLGQITCP